MGSCTTIGLSSFQMAHRHYLTCLFLAAVTTIVAVNHRGSAFKSISVRLVKNDNNHLIPRLCTCIFDSMKRVLAYLLMLLVLGETTSLNQLIKVPVLYTHFLEHNEHDPSVDFYTFLEWHYWGDDETDQDDDTDMQLPFKKFEHQSLTFLYNFSSKVVLQNICWPVTKDFNTDLPQVYFDPALSSLFRPPRS